MRVSSYATTRRSGTEAKSKVHMQQGCSVAIDLSSQTRRDENGRATSSGLPSESASRHLLAKFEDFRHEIDCLFSERAEQAHERDEKSILAFSQLDARVYELDSKVFRSSELACSLHDEQKQYQYKADRRMHALQKEHNLLKADFEQGMAGLHHAIRSLQRTSLYQCTPRSEKGYTASSHVTIPFEKDDVSQLPDALFPTTGRTHLPGGRSASPIAPGRSHSERPRSDPPISSRAGLPHHCDAPSIPPISLQQLETGRMDTLISQSALLSNQAYHGDDCSFTFENKIRHEQRDLRQSVSDLTAEIAELRTQNDCTKQNSDELVFDVSHLKTEMYADARKQMRKLNGDATCFLQHFDPEVGDVAPASTNSRSATSNRVTSPDAKYEALDVLRVREEIGVYVAEARALCGAAVDEARSAALVEARAVYDAGIRHVDEAFSESQALHCAAFEQAENEVARANRLVSDARSENQVWADKFHSKGQALADNAAMQLEGFVAEAEAGWSRHRDWENELHSRVQAIAENAAQRFEESATKAEAGWANHGDSVVRRVDESLADLMQRLGYEDPFVSTSANDRVGDQKPSCMPSGLTTKATETQRSVTFGPVDDHQGRCVSDEVLLPAHIRRVLPSKHLEFHTESAAAWKTS